ncbi:MAG: hypothetical protein Kow0068_16700 [Marinilabiliales bacterium]
MPDKKISELIQLYYEIKKISDDNKIGKNAISYFQNMNLMIGTYTMLKESLRPEQFQMMYKKMKVQLYDLIVKIKEEKIDEILKNNELSDDEINYLLDKKLEKLKKI